ncbi:MAG: hypothetical protein U1E32_05300, partial [Rhodoglobus sp.]|nr:hypothetical protein [Rhodoglobus sp.]
MSIPQVGQGAVAVVPTFKGFRKATDAEMAGSVRSAGNIFSNGFRSIGSNSGRGFKTSFDSASKGLAAGALKTLQSDVAKFSREVSAARLKEQDATGKLRVAEAQLAEARRRYASDASQVIRAEERLASLQRNALGTKASLIGSTDKLAAAQKRLATATAQASTDGVRQGGIFSRLSNLFESSGSDSASRFGNGFRTTFGAIFSGSFLADLAARAAFGAGQAVGAVIRSGFDYGMQGITLASDLEQSTGAIEAVFKDQVDIILDSARAAATEVGLTRAQFQSFATVVGSQLKNLGLPFDQVSGKTIDLIELGADLAAQFGGSTYDAVGALSSLLRGERDPIERYGVGLKQVDIDARKAALGMSELEGEADK